ncbi:hypothetical protein B0H65DRAFT_244931 [Neurospora tetraspora]|uniref:Secreted protein n=1 Tax=Neurospora tetraspora TaxID=94610 RepID=A0AAE0MRQ2_9PEZI|nr:hypothetical protein B0H65DRAFT_244931 [Neurospora tetraspora]
MGISSLAALSQLSALTSACPLLIQTVSVAIAALGRCSRSSLPVSDIPFRHLPESCTSHSPTDSESPQWLNGCHNRNGNLAGRRPMDTVKRVSEMASDSFLSPCSVLKV